MPGTPLSNGHATPPHNQVPNQNGENPPDFVLPTNGHPIPVRFYQDPVANNPNDWPVGINLWPPIPQPNPIANAWVEPDVWNRGIRYPIPQPNDWRPWERNPNYVPPAVPISSDDDSEPEENLNEVPHLNEVENRVTNVLGPLGIQIYRIEELILSLTRAVGTITQSVARIERDVTELSDDLRDIQDILDGIDPNLFP